MKNAISLMLFTFGFGTINLSTALCFFSMGLVVIGINYLIKKELKKYGEQ